MTGTIDLLSQLPTVSTPVTIDGPGAGQLNVTRSSSASTEFRFFSISPATGNVITIRDLTVSGARAGNSSGGALSMGGLGMLVIDSAVFNDNQTTTSGGAVLFNRGFTSIRNSTFTNNQADFGAAILGSQFVPNVGNGEIVDSTIAGNKATSFGGGVYTNVSHIQVLSSTIVGNVADSDDAGGGSGGGTYNAGADAAAFTVANTLYAGNKIGTTSPVNNQCGGAHTSSGYNLRETADAGCIGFTGTGEIAPAIPMLGTLGDNGGPTPTIALLTGSPAINAGNPATPADNAFPACPAADQRGVLRTGGGNRCDIGAFEKRTPTTTSVACAPSSLTLGAGTSACTATVTDAAALASPTGNVSFTTSGDGSFSNAGLCALSMVSGASASCSVDYTPSAVGTGSHLITVSYEGTTDVAPSQGTTQISVVAPPVPITTRTTGTTFNLKAAIRKCKKKFPKGPKRKKCIRRAKRRAGL